MSGFGVVIRVGTEDQAKKLARKIVDLTDEAGMLPLPVYIYKFKEYPDHGYSIVG